MTGREELARLLDAINWHNMSPLDMAEMIMRAGYRRCAIGQGATQYCPEAERARAELQKWRDEIVESTRTGP